MYLTLYKPCHVAPIALIEFRQSIGGGAVRGLKWLKDRLRIAKSKTLRTDLQHLEIYGYMSNSPDLNNLPRNTHRNIEPSQRPIRVSTDLVVMCVVDKLPIEQQG